MIEFDVDMGYLLDYDELDKVVLNDENGEHEPMEFVPKDAATVGAQDGIIDMDWVIDLVERHSDHIDDNGRTFHNGAYERMAAEIATMVGAVTCKLVDNDSGPDMHCTACGGGIDDDYRYFMDSWGYSRCPHCGARIIEEETE